MGSKITGPICDPNWEKAQIVFFDDMGRKQRRIGKPSEIANIWNELRKKKKGFHILRLGPYPLSRSRSTESQKLLLDAHFQRWEQLRKETKLRAREATK